jgi:hypothetical protein
MGFSIFSAHLIKKTIDVSLTNTIMSLITVSRPGFIHYTPTQDNLIHITNEYIVTCDEFTVTAYRTRTGEQIAQFDASFIGTSIYNETKIHHVFISHNIIVVTGENEWSIVVYNMNTKKTKCITYWERYGTTHRPLPIKSIGMRGNRLIIKSMHPKDEVINYYVWEVLPRNVLYQGIISRKGEWPFNDENYNLYKYGKQLRPYTEYDAALNTLHCSMPNLNLFFEGLTKDAVLMLFSRMIRSKDGSVTLFRKNADPFLTTIFFLLVSNTDNYFLPPEIQSMIVHFICYPLHKGV